MNFYGVVLLREGLNGNVTKLPYATQQYPLPVRRGLRGGSLKKL